MQIPQLDKNPGRYSLLSAFAAGILLGLKSQLYFLSFSEWQYPALRLAGGVVGGGIAVALLAFLVNWAQFWRPREARAYNLALMANSFLGAAALLWLVWPTASDFLWVLLGLLFCFTLARSAIVYSAGCLLALLLVAARLAWGVLLEDQPVWLVSTLAAAGIFLWCWRRGMTLRNATATDPLTLPDNPLLSTSWLLAFILLGGFFLRLAGLAHGLPDFIAHCDTPKQLELVPRFLSGDLLPGTSYPVGHVYIYALLIKLVAFFTAPDSPFYLWAIGQQGFMQYVATVRVLQIIISALMPLLAFMTARRLWGISEGLVAALLVALDPVHLIYSRQIMGDITQTFFVLLSFYGMVRILKGGGWLCYLLAGLAAGAAVSIKIYGGYIIVALFAAHFFRQERRPWSYLTLALTGLLVGLSATSPRLLLGWQDWLGKILHETTYQSEFLGQSNYANGLLYLFTGLARRFTPVWIGVWLASLVALMLRRRRSDWFMALAAGLALLLILGGRLNYLREWDFVNLTLFMNLASAAFLIMLWRWAGSQGILHRLAKLAVAVLLAGTVFIAMSDACIATYPDTMMMAKHWLSQHSSRDSQIMGGFRVSGTKWLPLQFQGKALPYDPYQLLEKPDVTKLGPDSIVVLETRYWDPPVPQDKIQPVQAFALKSGYWENPIINIYFPDLPPFKPQVILPLSKVDQTSPHFMLTPRARTQPLSLVVKDRPQRSRLGKDNSLLVFSDHPLKKMFFLAMGKGKVSLFAAPEVGVPLVLERNQPVSGELRPLRNLLPITPRNYSFSGFPDPEGTFAWVGLYADPLQAFPLLARLGRWETIRELGKHHLASQDVSAPAEAWLFYTAALAECKDATGAQAAASRVDAKFLRDYAQMASSDKSDLLARLATLASANPNLLKGQDSCWSASGDCLHASGESAEIKNYYQKDDESYLELPDIFLPGNLRVEVQLKWPAKAGAVTAKLLGHFPNVYRKPLWQGKLTSEQKVLTIHQTISEGPIHLGLHLQKLKGPMPTLVKILVKPDFKAIYQSRWRLLSEMLHRVRPRVE